MRILALVQGQYGHRIVEHLQKRAPPEWAIESLSAPSDLPPIVDEPEEFLPSKVSPADLLLALTESPRAVQLIPALARLSGVKAVIAPIDNSAWLPLGLKNQLQQELARMGVTGVFPKTFCTLTESSAGFRQRAEPHENECIASFARYFGKPRLRITVDPQSATIAEVTVERGAPCGSTHFAAGKLVGMAVGEAVPQAGLMAHYFPCLASMQREQIDDGLFEPLMNVSGYVMNEDVERAIAPFCRPR